jgi:hypothetical protein
MCVTDVLISEYGRIGSGYEHKEKKKEILNNTGIRAGVLRM